MVLIISEDKDESISLVCKWLNFYKINYFRINEDDEYDVKINKNDFVIYNEERSFDCKNVSFFWYRRGTIFLKSFLLSKKPIDVEAISNENIVPDKSNVTGMITPKKFINKRYGALKLFSLQSFKSELFIYVNYEKIKKQ